MQWRRLAIGAGLTTAAALLAFPRSSPSSPPSLATLSAASRTEFQFAWNAYKRYAWGHDELKPVSRAAKDWYAESLWMTPVDCLDTMWLMGWRDEAEKTKTAIVENLSFDKDIKVKNFEVTIRLLGGLLSSYQLMGDRRLLALAQDLGNRLLPAFESPTGMPYMYVNLKTGKVSGARSNPAEIGTLILEFGTLARLTGREVFYDKAKRALVSLYGRRSDIGLVGEEIDVETGEWMSRSSHIGGGIDSYYEYLVKCERLFGDSQCGAMARESLRAVNRYVADDGPHALWYGEADMKTGRRAATSYGALEAFFPAVLALSGDLPRARRLQDSSWRMWKVYGVEPDGFDYSTMKATAAAPSYPLRPEIIESAYTLSALTHDPRYIEMGRVVFDDIRRYCRTENGYTVLTSVVTKSKGDLMPSYFLAETLKYLYLLFTPEALDLHRVVFNTEAHPLQRTW